MRFCFFFFFQAEDGIRDLYVTGVQTCALPIYTVPGIVFVTGANVGAAGDSATYANCYNPTWGRQKARTFPVPGDEIGRASCRERVLVSVVRRRVYKNGMVDGVTGGRLIHTSSR